MCVVRQLRVVLILDVEDLSDEDRGDLKAGMCMDEGDEDLPALADYVNGEDGGAGAIAQLLGNGTLASEGIVESLFEGSDVYVTFTDSQVIEAAWVAP